MDRFKTRFRRLYFGYGSNLWLDQMARRCPESKFIGLGILQGWKWFINNRGYANVVRSPKDLVYGLVYEISPSDEASLDRSEGVPQAYTKESMEIEFQRAEGGKKVVAQSLVYIDERRVEQGGPREEYVHRMNMGINDAVARGLPEWYIEKYMRGPIPIEGG
jgi:gamma-glutamylcyclotransferase